MVGTEVAELGEDTGRIRVKKKPRVTNDVRHAGFLRPGSVASLAAKGLVTLSLRPPQVPPTRRAERGR